MDTLEELDTSGLRIYTLSPNFFDTFGEPGDGNKRIPVMDNLAKKVELPPPSNDTWKIIALKRNAAVLTRKTDFRDSAQDRYRDNDGSYFLHLMKSCPRSYLLGYLLPKGSPYIDHINRCISMLVETGIVNTWKNNGSINNEQSERRDRHARKYEELRVLSLADLQLSFYTLFVGWTSGVVSFLSELMWRKIYCSLRCLG